MALFLQINTQRAYPVHVTMEEMNGSTNWKVFAKSGPSRLLASTLRNGESMYSLTLEVYVVPCDILSINVLMPCQRLQSINSPDILLRV